MTKVIAISNPKGGVGKTTTTLNLAAGLAIAEHKVLIIDSDPASGISTACGITKENIKCGIFEIYSGSIRLNEAICSLPYLNIDVIPSNVFNSEQEIRLTELAKNRIQLKRQLHSLLISKKIDYDYVLIDTPPALNDLTIGALLASNSVLIPLQCSYYSLNSVGRLLQIIERIKKSANPNLEIEKIVLTFYEKGTRYSQRGAKLAVKMFRDYLSEIVIPKNAAIGYAAFEEKPVALVDVTSQGAKAYLALANQIIKKNLNPLPPKKHENPASPVVQNVSLMAQQKVATQIIPKILAKM